MSCEDTTGHCIISSPLGDFSVCCPPLFDGPGIPDGTPGKSPECWVGLPGSTSVPLSLRDLLGCDTGCIPCSDQPPQMLTMASDLSGTRWLAPDERQMASVDARGLYHDLRSNEGHLVPPLVVYRRGTCWSNDGRECFDFNVCSCWGVNTTPSSPPEGSMTCGGVALGREIGGLFPDEFFYVGDRWPFRSSGQGNTSQQGIYCRKFPDTLDDLSPDRDHGVVAAATGLFGIPDPIFLRTEGPDPRIHSCSTNYFVPCTARNEGGLCPGSFSNPVPGPDPQPPPDYYNNGTASRQRFNRLIIRRNTARLRDDSPMFPLADKRQIATKNKVLDIVRTGGFNVIGGACTPGSGSHCTDFRQLAYQLPALGNGAVGSYWRVYGARHLAIEVRPEVPDVFGPCEMEMSGCAVECRLRVDFILFQTQLYAEKLTTTTTISRPRMVEPHARSRILVDCSIEAKIVGDDPCVLRRPWLPPEDDRSAVGIGIVNAGRDDQSRALFVSNCSFAKEIRCLLGAPPAACFDDPAVVSQFPDETPRRIFCCDAERPRWEQECHEEWKAASVAERFPTVIPEGEDHIIFRNPEGEIFHPPLRTEWLGFLGKTGEHPRTSVAQRFEVTAGEIGIECGEVADGFRDLIIPGWPSMPDDNDGGPEHVYAGELQVGFV